MATLAVTVVTAGIPASAMAQDRYGRDHTGQDQRYDDSGDPRGWSDGRSYDYRRDDYPDRGYARQTPIRYVYRDDRDYADRGSYDQANYYRSYTGRATYRCQSSGTTGAIVGALAGALIGNGVAGRGDRTLGALLGGGAGALAGRAIDRSTSHC